MTVKEYIYTVGWNWACEEKDFKFMNVEIFFTDDKGEDDSVDFNIKAFDKHELSELFDIFCKENNFKNDTVYDIYIIKMANSIEKLY